MYADRFYSQKVNTLSNAQEPTGLWQTGKKRDQWHAEGCFLAAELHLTLPPQVLHLTLKPHHIIIYLYIYIIPYQPLFSFAPDKFPTTPGKMRK